MTRYGERPSKQGLQSSEYCEIEITSDLPLQHKLKIFFWFLGYSGSAQDLILGLCSGVSPDRAEETYGVLRIRPVTAVCKANTLALLYYF